MLVVSLLPTVVLVVSDGTSFSFDDVALVVLDGTSVLFNEVVLVVLDASGTVSF